MGKTKIVETGYLLSLWCMSIELTFFPDALLNELHPGKLLKEWGDDLPNIRERLRPEVDELIESLVDYHSPEELWHTLRKTDPEMLALYADRLNAATFALETYCKGKKEVAIPASWTTVVLFLLLQKPWQ